MPYLKKSECIGEVNKIQKKRKKGKFNEPKM
jgi:hypothetical protein